MEKISRTLRVPKDLDDFITEQAKKEVRSTSNFYILLAERERRRSQGKNQEGARE